VKGQGQVTQDREKLQELWSESLRVWFDGKLDPSLVLIKVSGSEAEYWNTSGTEGVSFALRAAKAIITGEKMRGTDDVDIHAKVRL
jgi:general stress protein 26